METKNSLLRGDYWFQTILGVIMITCCVSIVGFYFILLIAIPFGAWQVLSGLCFGIGYKDKKRLQYLVAVAGYFLLMYSGRLLSVTFDISYERSSFFDIIYTIMLLITPAILGIYYYIITYRAYHNIEQKTTNDYINDNILDT